jgi:hypothetical protein
MLTGHLCVVSPELLQTIARAQSALLVLSAIYAVCWMITIYHCLDGQKGVDRLTWLCVLVWIPVLGVFFYFSLAKARKHDRPDWAESL